MLWPLTVTIWMQMDCYGVFTQLCLNIISVSNSTSLDPIEVAKLLGMNQTFGSRNIRANESKEES